MKKKQSSAQQAVAVLIDVLFVGLLLLAYYFVQASGSGAAPRNSAAGARTGFAPCVSTPAAAAPAHVPAPAVAWHVHFDGNRLVPILARE